MDNSEKQSVKKYGLGKDEIIRGHNAYINILSNSGSFVTGYLKAFVNTSTENRNSELRSSPLFTDKVKVGFIVARKKKRKAADRNRIRRLMKESYRLNKSLFNGNMPELSVLFTLSDHGYKAFLDKDLKRQDLDEDMKKLIRKINNKEIRK